MGEIITIQTKVRLAVVTDLVIAPNLLRLGQPYYIMLKSKELVGVFVIDNYTNSQVLKELFVQKKIYVPDIPADDFIMYNLQQTDLKKITDYGHNIYKPSRAIN